jgi:hypothetical protein
MLAYGVSDGSLSEVEGKLVGVVRILWLPSHGDRVGVSFVQETERSNWKTKVATRRACVSVYSDLQIRNFHVHPCLSKTESERESRDLQAPMVPVSTFTERSMVEI